MLRPSTSSGKITVTGNTVGPRPPRYHPDTSDRDPESNGKLRRLVARVPGIHNGAPRRNALVTLTYLVSVALLLDLFGRLLEFLP